MWGSLEQVSGGNLPQELAWEAGGKEKPHISYGVIAIGGAVAVTHTPTTPES